MITELPDPCWTADGEPDGHHWDDDQEDAPGCTRLSRRCLIVTCDGLPARPCGEELTDEDEGWVIHSGTAQEASSAAVQWGWEITTDGIAMCSQCREERAEPAPVDLGYMSLPAEIQRELEEGGTS